jgi:ATP-dependent protease HslVU (ClpYQ) peptidase subunit
MGGDSLCCWGDSHECDILAHPKVWLRNSVLYGAAGDVRIFQVLQRLWTAPVPDNTDPFTWVTREIAPNLKKLLTEHEIGDPELLVGLSGRLFEVSANYTVTENTSGYSAVGSGRQVAKGSLHSTAKLKITPERRIRMALEAAEFHLSGVRGPFHFLKIEGP